MAKASLINKLNTESKNVVPEMIRVQVCFAKQNLNFLRELQVPSGTTLRDAIIQSGLLNLVEDLDLSLCAVGIFNKIKNLDTVLREHDRVEIYRPLIADPKESRRRRVEKKRDAPA